MTAMFLLTSPAVFAEETETDSALWSGALFLFEDKNTLDYSIEYQLRLDDHMSSFSNHFVEFMSYKKATSNLLVNGGYRYTRRTDHSESRLYFGGFLDLTRSEKDTGKDSDQFRAILQIGYQHDFNTKFDHRHMGSNSIRCILTGSKPITEKVAPFLMAGVLTSWNDAYSFGIDKIRLGGGAIFQVTESSRIRAQYIWEQSRFTTPRKNTNIIWLRYKKRFGKST